jgi:hypothetical protein
MNDALKTCFSSREIEVPSHLQKEPFPQFFSISKSKKNPMVYLTIFPACSLGEVEGGSGRARGRREAQAEEKSGEFW